MDTKTYICKLPSNTASTNTQEIFTSFLQTNKNAPPWVMGGGGHFSRQIGRDMKLTAQPYLVPRLHTSFPHMP